MVIIKKQDFPYRNFINKIEIFKMKTFKKKELTPYQKLINNFGKWYSIKYYWAEFMYSDSWENKNEFKLNKKYHLHELKFKHNSLTDLNNPSFNKILVIKTKKNIIKFCKKYMIEEPSKNYYGSWDYPQIDWNKVVKDFGGIEITVNPSHNIREGKYTSWYSSWDIQSGCIWNDKIIKKVTKIV
jgi:hypothetical protein